MKITLKLLIGIACLSFVKGSYAQQATLDSLFQSTISEFKPSGWAWFYQNTMPVSQIFSTYKPALLPDSNDDLVLIKSWTDNQLQSQHARYQQTHNGIPVEGAEFTEHCQNGYVIYAHGKLCPQISVIYKDGYITEFEAMNSILSAYPEAEFAWENLAYENELKSDLNDVNATYFPHGELMFALNALHTVQFTMNPYDYRMAWKFDIYSLSPYFHKNIYVDAHTGVIFNEEQLICSNGTADIVGHGSQTIDTRFVGFLQQNHKLKSNDGSTNVHTKNYQSLGTSFSNTAEVTNSTSTWGSNHWQSTNAHWCVTQTWLYYESVHSRVGMSGNNIANEVKVFADKEWVTATTNNGEKNGAWYDHTAGIDRIYAGYFNSAETEYTGELSIMAHEFTHGVDQREGKLKYEKESGALDESFADIFGFLTRRHVTNSSNWVIGATNFQNREKRNLQNPSTHGIHYNINTTTNTYNEQPGQPDTYEGNFWFDVNIQTSLDNGGVHVNSGVQNFWFYLLCQGGSGTNDNGDPYSVAGIGYADAAEITYYNFVNNMQRKSQFEDAMEGSIEAAEELFGVCSAQAIATEEAWYAVGLGSGSTCQGAGISEAAIGFDLYPNPTQNSIEVEFSSSQLRTLELYNLKGQLLRTYSVSSSKARIDMSDLSSGIYLIKEKNNESSVKKVIKN